jgi:hypothetical protein
VNNTRLCTYTTPTGPCDLLNAHHGPCHRDPRPIPTVAAPPPEAEAVRLALCSLRESWLLLSSAPFSWTVHGVALDLVEERFGQLRARLRSLDPVAAAGFDPSVWLPPSRGGDQ